MQVITPVRYRILEDPCGRFFFFLGGPPKMVLFRLRRFPVPNLVPLAFGPTSSAGRNPPPRGARAQERVPREEEACAVCSVRRCRRRENMQHPLYGGCPLHIASKSTTNHGKLQGFPCSLLAIFRASTVARVFFPVVFAARRQHEYTFPQSCTLTGSGWIFEARQPPPLTQHIDTHIHCTNIEAHTHKQAGMLIHAHVHT